MNYEVYLKRAKGKSGAMYNALLVDVGYDKVVVSFEAECIAQILDKKRRELADFPEGETCIGELIIDIK